MRKNRMFLLVAISLSGLLLSCQKVIDLKLNTSSPQIVIEGNVYDQPGPDTVRISKSVNFDSTNVFPAVSGATVIIDDNAGNSETLTEIYPGTYITSSLRGIPGRTYTLSVQTGEETFTANSTMPTAVAIDSVYLENSWFTNQQVNIEFKDPPNVTNYYRLIEFVNNVQVENFFVTNDKLNNGEMITYTIWNDTNRLKSGRIVTIWLECIDESVYNYFRTASLNGEQTISPSNPLSNISKGALGYFNACTVRKKSIIVP
jgi:hypothetical protein